jgi:hypothetical protein
MNANTLRNSKDRCGRRTEAGAFQWFRDWTRSLLRSRQRGDGRVRERRRGSGKERSELWEGGNLNQLDNQTAVHEGEPYMLYSKARNKSMKRETSEGGRQGERETGYMCVDEQNESGERRKAWSVGSTNRVKAIGTKGGTINSQEE